jgi:hypothetical protein
LKEEVFQCTGLSRKRMLSYAEISGESEFSAEEEVRSCDSLTERLVVEQEVA